ncbi:MAG: hypothetical protein JXB48_12470 [Candidatus Latescibacteria bacterium]|nr:hypothetical protein [Candidatus Latescibacterota bacterium]
MGSGSGIDTVIMQVRTILTFFGELIAASICLYGYSVLIFRKKIIKNNGNTMFEFEENKNTVRTEKSQIINAPIKNVFPLACPVMEYKWIPGWKCELIHCPNGHVELGTVFREITSAPVLANGVIAKTTWTAVLYEPENFRVYYRLDNKISSSLYKIKFETDSSGRTKNRLEIIYTPLNEKGRNNIKKYGITKLQLMIDFIFPMLKYYCEYGEMIGFSELVKIVRKSSWFGNSSFKDRLFLGVNQLAQKMMRDQTRKRFLGGLPVSKVKPVSK